MTLPAVKALGDAKDALFDAANHIAQAETDRSRGDGVGELVDSARAQVAKVASLLDLIALPPEPEFADDSLTVQVVERYTTPGEDAPERSVTAHAVASERLLAPRSWLNREVSMQVEDLERAWRMIAEHAAGELARLHEGKVPGRTGSGFSQFDQALLAVRTAPVVIHSLIDGAVNAAYYGSDES